jgi:hypothetical protein
VAYSYYAYLDDVTSNDARSPEFAGSRWFTRGWTLQELIAPLMMVFYGKCWGKIQEKSELVSTLQSITGINAGVLQGEPLGRVAVAKRMSWAARRQTTREEDVAYCLLGIFNVNMPILYGEGSKAFVRLQEEIMKDSDDQPLFAWTATHESAARFPYRGLPPLTFPRYIDSILLFWLLKKAILITLLSLQDIGSNVLNNAPSTKCRRYCNNVLVA